MTPELTADSPGEAPKQILSTAGMTTKVVKGSMWTLAGQVAPLAVSLVTTPFVIRMLGAEGYGVLILVGLIPTYLGFADFGMSMASTKFASEAYAEGDVEKEARIVRTAALIAFLSSLPFGIAIFALSGWLVTLFNVPEYLLGDASLALKLASVTFVVNFLNLIFNTPQLTRLRMDLNTFVTSGFRILGLIATPIALYIGFGIVGCVAVLLIASLLTLASHILLSRRLLPHLLDLGVDSSVIRPMLNFGSALLFAGIAGIFLGNAEKGVLSGLVSVTALAYYSVAFTLAGLTTMLSSAMLQSLIPAFSQLTAPNRDGEFRELFDRCVALNLITLFPGALFFLMCAESFFTIWAGPEYGHESGLPFYILLGGLLFNIPGFIPYSVLVSVGKTGTIAKLYWLEVVPYLALLFLLTTTFGIVGAAVAWSIRAAFDGIVFFALVKRFVRSSTPILRPRSFLICFSGAVYFFCGIMALIFQIPLVTKLLLFLILTSFFLFLIWKLMLSQDERRWIFESLRFRIT